MEEILVKIDERMLVFGGGAKFAEMEMAVDNNRALVRRLAADSNVTLADFLKIVSDFKGFHSALNNLEIDTDPDVKIGTDIVIEMAKDLNTKLTTMLCPPKP